MIATALFPCSTERLDFQLQQLLRLLAHLQKPQKPRNKHFEGDCILIVGAFLAVSPSSREGQPRCFLSFFSRSERKGRVRERGDGQVVWVREERINICRSTAPPCCATRDKLCGVTVNRGEIYRNCADLSVFSAREWATHHKHVDGATRHSSFILHDDRSRTYSMVPKYEKDVIQYRSLIG